MLSLLIVFFFMFNNNGFLQITDIKLWLRIVYNQREQWAACFTWRHLMYGIHSTQRSEAIHSSIACWCSKTNMLVELYMKLSFLAKTQSMISATQYVQELWKQSVNTVPGDFATFT